MLWAFLLKNSVGSHFSLTSGTGVIHHRVLICKLNRLISAIHLTVMKKNVLLEIKLQTMPSHLLSTENISHLLSLLNCKPILHLINETV